MGSSHSPWILCTLIPYQDAQAGYGRLGLGHRVVVMDLMSRLRKGPPYHVFFDNFFPAYHCSRSLENERVGASATARTNRTEKVPVKCQN